MIGINLKESLFIKTKRESKSSVGLDVSKECALDNSSVKSEKSKSSTSTMKKHVLAFPEQVWPLCGLMQCFLLFYVKVD